MKQIRISSDLKEDLVASAKNLYVHVRDYVALCVISASPEILRPSSYPDGRNARIRVDDMTYSALYIYTYMSGCSMSEAVSSFYDEGRRNIYATAYGRQLLAKRNHRIFEEKAELAKHHRREMLYFQSWPELVARSILMDVKREGIGKWCIDFIRAERNILAETVENTHYPDAREKGEDLLGYVTTITTEDDVRAFLDWAFRHSQSGRIADKRVERKGLMNNERNKDRYK